ncbi:MAG: hypothetical protein HY807_09995 [Nitrospirae bacterium]|nr:hypothetical protein [Nitrospirota bacterium]
MIISKLKYVFVRPALLTALSALFFLTVSCSGGGGGSASSDSTSVTINLGQRERSSGALSLQAIPDAVASVVIKVTGPQMSPIARTINIYDFTVLNELIQVPTGAERLFEVIAHDETDGNGIMLFKGSVKANLSGAPVSLTVIMQSTDYDIVLGNGLDAFAAGDILSARNFLKEAVSLFGNSTSNQADTARFFYAFARVFALGFEVSSDGNASNGINTAGEIADLFDCVVSGVSPLNPALFDVQCPQLLPVNSPTGGQLQGYLYNVVRPELIGAIDNFNDISDTFNVIWLEPGKPESAPIESDYGDVLAFRAMAKSMLSLILTQQAYNLNIDIDALDSNVGMTNQQFLAENPSLLSLTTPSHLVNAKGYLTGSALDDSVAAIDWILAEADDQSDDFISIDVGPNPWQIPPDEIAQARTMINNLRGCLDAACTLDNNETPGDASDDTIMDFSRFYAGEVDFRELLPEFAGDEPRGFLPDPGFGGVIIQTEDGDPSINNEDLNGNDTADILEKDIYYVYGGSVGFPIDLQHPENSGYQFLGIANSSAGIGAFTGDHDYYLIKNFRRFAGFEKHYDVKLDSIEFVTSAYNQYCCFEAELWHSAPSYFLFNDSPDGVAFDMHADDYILLQWPASSGSVENFNVYTLP